MSEYTSCQACGSDLGANGRSFGLTECCCDNGYCLSCCDDDDEATP